jgi:hypothetical protein
MTIYDVVSMFPTELSTAFSMLSAAGRRRAKFPFLIRFGLLSYFGTAI